MSEARSIKRREDVYATWDGRNVIIRQQAVASTIVYPQLPRGVSYPSFQLREQYILARVRSVREGILWCNRRNYQYGVLGVPDIRGPLEPTG